MQFKGKSSSKNLGRFLIVLFVLFSSVSFVSPKVQAAFDPLWLWKGGFNAAHLLLDKEYRENSIVKTALTAGTTFLTALPAHLVLGRNPDELTNCAMIVRDLDISGNLTGPDIPHTTAYIDAEIAAGRMTADDLKIYEEAASEVVSYESGTCNFNDTPLSVADSGHRGSGSLLAITASLDQSLRRDEIPVSMAYFFKDYAQRIPVLKNTAFAQTSDTYLGASVVYEVWRLVRDISLGLMSLILLVLGIMIMTRKKINPQAVVTVQNTLPRIAISIVLIFFSYVIGAFLVKFTFPLITLMPSIVFRLVDFSQLNFAPTVTAYAAMSLVGWGILAVTGLVTGGMGFGMAMLFLVIILLLALILVVLIAVIKSLIIYVKLLTYIVISPLYFAIGVIPGKEDMIKDWFKEMLSGVLSIAAMSFMISFSLALPIMAMGSTFNTPASQFVNATITAMFIPTMMLFLLFTALKMPKKVSSWIKGDPKKH